MKFGRVEAHMLPQIDFRLPAAPPATHALLRGLRPCAQPPACYIGCSVWTDRSFVGRVYPPKTRAKDFLAVYCKQFNTVELNTTFYSIPSAAKVKRWKEVATPGFKFCPKLSKSISHRNNLDEPRHLLDSFLEAVLHFEEALGMTFLQLPPYFQPGGISALQRFLGYFPEEFLLAVEFRHPAWFEDAVAWQEMMAYLQERRMAVAITDVAGRRDVLHLTLTADCAFIRFVGNDLHSTDYARIDAWVQQLSQWMAQGLSQVYFLLHEPQKALCADLAVYMIGKLNKNKREGLAVAPPKLLDQQGSLF